MNLIQITEQLKNPAVSVQQLMQYANNSNPEVPSYVALAEMQRRQSIQSPPQPPQQTVKDQLGAQLMGLPAAPGAPQQPAPGAPAPGAAPQQSPQPPTQQASQPAPEQVPMPQPKEALPMQPGMQPGMAGGGLATIPLNMHHDFAAGGIIAFADGGFQDITNPEQITEEQAQTAREKAERARGIGEDPYAEAKRRYAEIEAKQKESEKDAGFRNVIASLAAMGSGKPRRFGESMATYAETATGLEKEQQKASEQNATKMAELHALWGKEQDALKRAALAADMGQVAQSKAARLEAVKLGHQAEQIKAQNISANASASQAATQAREQQFKEQNYPKEYELDRIKALAMGSSAEERILTKLLTEARAKDPKATLADVYEKYKTAGAGISKTGALTQEQLVKAWNDLKVDERMNLIKAADGNIEQAKQRFFASNAGLNSGLAGLPKGTGAPGTPSGMSNAQLKAALGIQ